MTVTPSLGRRITAGVFMAALLAPGVAVATSGQVRATVSAVVADPASWSEESNRLRAATPLWDNAVAAYSTLLYRAGASSNEAIGVVGKGGWMFLGDFANANFSQAVSRRVLSADEVDAWAAVVAEQREWLATRDIPMVVAVGPAKWSVYPDRLPAWADDVRSTTSFDAVLDAHPELGVVDLRPALREAAESHDTYSALNSHWTDYGAFVGWRELADELERTLPGLDVDVPELVSVRTRDDGPNEYDAMLGVRAPNPWTFPEFDEPLSDFDVVREDGTRESMTGETQTGLLDMPRTTLAGRAGNDLTALVMRDSMGDGLSPYLQAAFGRTVQVRHNVDDPSIAPNLQAWVDEVQPDVVVVEMAERHFNSPLQDLEMWRAANAFDRLDAARELRWAPLTGDEGMSVDGDLEPGGSVEARWAAGPESQVVRITVDADGPATVKVVPPDGSEQLLRVAPGANVLFASLPGGVASAELRVEGDAAVELAALAVRASG